MLSALTTFAFFATYNGPIHHIIIYYVVKYYDNNKTSIHCHLQSLEILLILVQTKLQYFHLTIYAKAH